MTYSASGLPTGLTVDPTTGIISGTIDASADTSSPYSITVDAADSVTGTDDPQSFSWTVSPVTVTLSSPGDQTNYDADTVSLQLSASDTAGHTLSYSLTSGAFPSGLSLDGNGLISGTISNTADQDGPYSVTITATDSPADASDTQTFNWNVNNPVALTNPGDQTNFDGDAGISLQLSATDADGNSVTYSVTSGSLPSGLSLDTSSGLISGNISSTADTDSPYSIQITATDSVNTGISASGTFEWAVFPPGVSQTNGTVTMFPPGDVTLIAGSTGLDYGIGGSVTDGDTLTYSVSGLPSYLSYDATDQAFVGNIPSDAANTSFNVTVTATDPGTGDSASATSIWYIDPPQVIVSSPGNQLNHAGDTVSAGASGDALNGDALTYSASGLPSFPTLDPTTGLISGTVPLNASAAVYSITETGADSANGASASTTFTWTIDPATVTMSFPGDQGNLPSDSVSLSTGGTASDGDSLTYSATGLPDGLSVNSLTGVITGTVADDAPSSTVYTVTVTGNDSGSDATGNTTFYWTINPALVSLTDPGDQTNFDGDTVFLPTTASTRTGNAIDYSASGLPSGLSIDSATGDITGTISSTADTSSPYSVTVTASAAGGSASQTFNWTVSPVTVSLAQPADQTNCDGDTVSLELAATDSANHALTFTASGLPDGLSIDPDSGEISGTISDDAGTGITDSVTVTAMDASAAVSSSQTFDWNLVEINVVNPGDQSNFDGDSVDLPIEGSVSYASADVFAYSATGLPPGLAIDTESGVISGTIGSTADTGSPYSVTVTYALHFLRFPESIPRASSGG